MLTVDLVLILKDWSTETKIKGNKHLSYLCFKLDNTYHLLHFSVKYVAHPSQTFKIKIYMKMKSTD